jgi:hypothetical protein
MDRESEKEKLKIHPCGESFFMKMKNLVLNFIFNDRTILLNNLSENGRMHKAIHPTSDESLFHIFYCFLDRCHFHRQMSSIFKYRKNAQRLSHTCLTSRLFQV